MQSTYSPAPADGICSSPHQDEVRHTAVSKRDLDTGRSAHDQQCLKYLTSLGISLMRRLRHQVMISVSLKWAKTCRGRSFENKVVIDSLQKPSTNARKSIRRPRSRQGSKTWKDDFNCKWTIFFVLKHDLNFVNLKKISELIYLQEWLLEQLR